MRSSSAARSDGHFYFLECAARVGGAYISEMVEIATGINLWREWARIEIAGGKEPYQLPAVRSDYAGLILSLARQEDPDTSAYNDPEIALRLKRRHHAGLVLRSSDPARMQALLENYSRAFRAKNSSPSNRLERNPRRESGYRSDWSDFRVQ